ncbi:hypothetical protein [Paenibacillus silvae]|uniref:Uncharacterized protein n=1 Tax=Paenibacillus silvae TaxID=1325358 RepID=A0A2W6NNN4_9BACL|nr:hypothetical protein [Paenibacillus silvae]PZT57375.1 hypothetical protein DN757_01585 [Paenibacillus silvae]
MFKVVMSVLYNSGVERVYELSNDYKDEITLEEARTSVEYMQNDLIKPAYKSGSNGYISVESEGSVISINLQQTSEIKFRILEQ